MKKHFLAKFRVFIFVSCSIQTLQAFAQDLSLSKLHQSYQYHKVAVLLRDAESLTVLPELQEFTSLLSEREVETVSVQSQPRLKAVTDLFYRTQAQIFLGKLITLKYCLRECGFSAEYKLKEIHFSIDQIEQILSSKVYSQPRDVLVFISAHEIAHYVHELSTRAPYPPVIGFSIHGNPSAYRDQYSVFVNALSDAEKQEFFQGNSDSKVNKDFQQMVKEQEVLGMRSHAEVDMIATMALLKAGFTNWKDVLLFFDEKIREEKLQPTDYSDKVILDFENRKRVVLKTLDENR